MTAIARTGRSEAFAEQRVALSVLVTLAAPVAVLAFFISSTVGRFGPLAVAGPTAIIIVGPAAFFLYTVANSAFAAATRRRRSRYELLLSLGASRQNLRTLLRWELGLPAALGIGVGLVLGTSIGFVLNPFDIDPEPGLSIWFGMATSAFVVALPAIIGVLAAASASAKRVGSPRTSIANSRPIDATSFTKHGRNVLAVALPLLGISAFAFVQFEALSGLYGLGLGVLGTLAGVTLLTPAIFGQLSKRLLPPTSPTSSLDSLSGNPRRVMGLAGSILALTALVVMAAAGIISDEDQSDDAGDRRQIITSPAVLENVELIAAEHDNSVAGSVVLARVTTSGIIEADELDGGIITVRHQTAPLTNELAALLELSEEEIAFVENGGALIDSEVLGDLVQQRTVGAEYEPLPTLRIRKGGGIGQPGPTVYVADENSLDISEIAEGAPTIPLDLFIRFEEPISTELFIALRDTRGTRETRVSLPRDNGDVPILWILTGLAAALLFSQALSASNLASVELDDEFSTLVSLGAPPSIRPKVLAIQSLWLTGLGVALGSSMGVVLFWFVTRGDPSVPDPIVPLETIGVLLGTALLATAVIRIMHSPAEPAPSSRISGLVGA